MISRLLGFYKLRFNLILFLTLLVLISIAWSNRFIQDDAFITFRYAYNFAKGNGLVWNEGELIQGYTSFLWTLVMSIPLYFNIDPITFSYVLGMVFFIFSLIFTYKVSLLIFNSRNIGLLTIILLGTNYTFSSYATSGFGTQLQACLFVTSLYLLLRSIYRKDWKNRTMVMLSLLLSCSMFTRLDSALLIIVIFPFALFFLQKEMITTPKKLIKMLLLILPFTVFVGSWFIWKLSYYGDILPNTFYVKVSSPTSIKLGVFYFYLFLFSYWLIPFLFIGLIALKGLLKKENLAIVISLILIVVWSLYVIKVGGDFLEFRFIVPILPLVFIVIIWLTLSFIQQKQIQIVLIALVLLGSLHHTITFAVLTNKLEIESIKQLYGHLKNSNENWAEIGRVFGKIFDYNPNVTIAVTAAGAIPFYSRLKTIDMLGLNDRWVAKYGDVIGTRPGHQRRAPFSYLLERKVNIVIAHPWLIKNDGISEKKYTIEHLETFGVKNEDEVPPYASIIEIPIDHNYRLVTLYLTRSPIVDEAIQRYCLDEYPILR